MPTPAEEILITNPGEIPLISGIDENTSFLAIKNGIIQRVPDAMMAARYGQSGVDTTPPTITARVVSNANPNQIALTFSEPVTATAAGFSARRNTTSWAVSSIAGSGTSWTLTMATNAAAGETIDLSYNSATGNTLDGAGNELASFTNSSVTNNIGGLDADAEAYLTAEGITNATIRGLVNDFVVGWKADSLWAKTQFIHPFLGTARRNLRNPADSNAAFRATLTGDWVINANGITGNGIDTYLQTHWTQSLHGVTQNLVLGFYSRTNVNGGADIDNNATGQMRTALYARTGDQALTLNGTGPGVSATNTNSQGLYIMKREGHTSLKLWKNANLLGEDTTDVSGSAANGNPLMLGVNFDNGVLQGNFAARNYAFFFGASTATAWTDADVAAARGRITTLLTGLNRLV